MSTIIIQDQDFIDGEENGIITRTGTIVDATFVDAPKQRNTREENKTIKSGDIPDDLV